MKRINLGLAWNWEFDKDFIFGIERECSKLHLTTYRIEKHNVNDTLKKIRSGKLRFQSFLDRASDEEESFIPLAKYFARSSSRVFNRLDDLEGAKDKATMHLRLMTHGVNVPYTIIIAPYSKNNEMELSLTELAHLGRPFIIKPANTTGGGIGVVTGAETLKEIIETRQHHKNDKYLLQETIIPEMLGHRKAWFRVFYAFGIVISCWWDPETHIYKEVSPHENVKYNLGELHEIIIRIHNASKLDFFSSEIARVKDGRCIAVDYVNEICDMRPQSAHYDGVPDAVILKIQKQIIKLVASLTIKRA